MRTRKEIEEGLPDGQYTSPEYATAMFTKASLEILFDIRDLLTPEHLTPEDIKQLRRQMP